MQFWAFLIQHVAVWSQRNTLRIPGGSVMQIHFVRKSFLKRVYVCFMWNCCVIMLHITFL